MSNLSVRAASYAGRPLLLRPADAEAFMRRLVAADPRMHERAFGPLAFLRRKGLFGGRKPAEAWDEDGEARPPMTAPASYCPVWLPGEPEAEGDWGWTLSQGVALFNIDSPLGPNGTEFCGTWFHGYDTISAAVDEMIADPRVGAVFIRADCPGGVVHGGMYALADKLRSVRAAAGGKPIWVYADLAASAMYWLAASCDRIVCSRVGIVGSIGAVITHVNYAGALAQDGVEVTSIQFGDFKTDGVEWKPLSAEGRAHLQSEIDQIGRDFVGAVVAGRPQLSAEEVIATQAGCYLAWNDDPARSGVGLKLVDEIMEESEAFAALAALVAQPPVRPTTTNPAAVPADPSATPSGATMERKMKRSTVAAIVANAALTDTQKLAQIKTLAEMPSPAVEPDEDDEDEELDEDGNPIVKPVADPAPGTTPDKGDAVDAATAEAVLDLPEAKGREALARKLAFTPGMKLAQAKSLLAVAPRASSLSDRMAGRDPKVDPTAGGAPAPGSLLVADAKKRKAAAKR